MLAIRRNNTGQAVGRSGRHAVSWQPTSRSVYLHMDALQSFIHSDWVRGILGLLTSKSKTHALLVSNSTLGVTEALTSKSKTYTLLVSNCTLGVTQLLTNKSKTHPLLVSNCTLGVTQPLASNRKRIYCWLAKYTIIELLTSKSKTHILLVSNVHNHWAKLLQASQKCRHWRSAIAHYHSTWAVNKRVEKREKKPHIAG